MKKIFAICVIFMLMAVSLVACVSAPAKPKILDFYQSRTIPMPEYIVELSITPGALAQIETCQGMFTIFLWEFYEDGTKKLHVQQSFPYEQLEIYLRIALGSAQSVQRLDGVKKRLIILEAGEKKA